MIASQTAHDMPSNAPNQVLKSVVMLRVEIPSAKSIILSCAHERISTEQTSGLFLVLIIQTLCA
ncbi:hypothetical protein SCLCIDRAFT_1222142 [Scleroderma citrinum Foug A]|uniref:Uncharacterized protein n=1 Tax=Scleroderma citrinum Foug A TaxID=1036808 RepID=A0A0C3DCZ1_9AGAM|nr:hypothetical protein SCLCIDRAFT_1222142 [Scleroderma citrinum Foug A]